MGQARVVGKGLYHVSAGTGGGAASVRAGIDQEKEGTFPVRGYRLIKKSRMLRDFLITYASTNGSFVCSSKSTSTEQALLNLSNGLRSFSATRK